MKHSVPTIQELIKIESLRTILVNLPANHPLNSLKGKKRLTHQDISELYNLTLERFKDEIHISYSGKTWSFEVVKNVKILLVRSYIDMTTGFLRTERKMMSVQEFNRTCERLGIFDI
jgi:hypothetical protein